MKKKKEGIKLNINLSNRVFYTLIVIGILAIVSVGVWAYGTIDITKIRVYKSANNQQIPGVTETKITFQTENFDTLGEFSDSRFTCIEEGYYDIYAHALVQELGDLKSWNLYIYKNEREIARTQWISPGAGSINNPTIDAKTLIYLEEGDYIEIYCLHTQTNNRVIYSNEDMTYVEINRLN